MPSGKHRYPQYTLRTSEGLMDKLKYIAEYNGRSANRELEQLIRAHVSRYEQKHGPIELTTEDYRFIRGRNPVPPPGAGGGGGGGNRLLPGRLKARYISCKLRPYVL